ncbi:MAG: hypothetical protein PHH54_01100 [Candidatus Nanoarchaeia archaeon]|nr:hypothetical protein [Candidatus Nanoarchaeia archaeon]MDD5740561.1 hypothetical protein [Candidatus Nanoarchaeia archaeon]
MIALNDFESLSPILLTVVLIIYLIVIELGNKRTRKALLPFVIILAIIFFTIAIRSIYATYTGLK